MKTMIVESPDAMRALGREIAARLSAGEVVLLHGDLGAGKTTLTQGMAEGLGIRGAITSPTFTLVAEHPLRTPVRGIERLFHLDLYRLNDPAELESFGFDDYLAPVAGVSVIEWPERAGEWLPDEALIVEIEHLGADQRRVSIRRLVNLEGPATR